MHSLRSQSYPSYARLSEEVLFRAVLNPLARLSPAITPALQLIVSEGCRTLFEISSYVSFGIIRDNLNLRHLPREFTSVPIDRFWWSVCYCPCWILHDYFVAILYGKYFFFFLYAI